MWSGEPGNLLARSAADPRLPGRSCRHPLALWFDRSTPLAVTRVRAAPVVDYSWQARAACAGIPGEVFVGPDDERLRDRIQRESLALRVCRGCPVRDACLQHALQVPERYGVWGNTTPEERLTLRAADRAAQS